MDAYLDNTLIWVKEVWRVLKPSGSFVLNLGDCFIGGGRGSVETRAVGGTRALGKGKGQAPPPNWKSLKERGTADWKTHSSPRAVGAGDLGGIYKTKQLLLVSSFAYCRIISETDFVCRGEHLWCKPNVPSPIRSRLKHSHEKLYWFVKDPDKNYWVKTPWMRKILGQENNQKRMNGSRPIASAENLKLGASSCFRPGEKTGKINEETIEHSWRVLACGAKQNGFELGEKPLSEHIAPFPEELIRPYIKSLAPPLGVVLDPFLGSGTTMRVAMEEGRSAIGIELSEKYIAYAKKRLNWGSGLGVEYL